MKKLILSAGSFILLFNCFAQAPINFVKSNEYQKMLEHYIRVPMDKWGMVKSEEQTASTEAPANKSEATEVKVASSTTTEVEVHAGVNPTDPNVIVVSPMEQGQQLQMPIYYTGDGGTTWKRSSFAATPHRPGGYTVGGGDPMFAFDKSSGRVYFSWLDVHFPTTPPTAGNLYFGMYWAYSDNGGLSWVKPSDNVIWEGVGQFNGSQITGISKANPDKQWFTVDNTNGANKGTLYCTFARAITTTGGWELVLKKKPAGSNAFSASETPIANKTTFPYAQFVSCNVAPDGTLHVIFMAVKSGVSYVAFYHAKSTNGGTSFSTPTEISNFRFQMDQIHGQGQGDKINGVPAGRAYPSPHFAADPTNGNLYMTFTAFGLDNTVKDYTTTNIYFTKSTNGGTSWSTPIIINDNNPAINQDNFYSSINVNSKGEVVVSWYDRRDDPSNIKAHYYYTLSRDGGETWDANQKITSTQTDFSKVGLKNNGFGVGEYNQVLITDNAVIPVWVDGRKGTGDNDVYAAVIGISSVGLESFGTISEETWLKAVYPNPSTTEASIEYGSTKEITADITLIDINGKIVNKLYSGEIKTGEHKMRITTKDLAAGTYYVVMKSDDFSAVRKLVVE